MERIAEALARSRTGEGAGSTQAGAALRPVGEPAERPGAPGDIVYTQTRSLPVSGALLRDKRVMSALGPGPVADAYRILSIQVTQRLREMNGNALAVVSPGDGEGKTLTAVNLAVSLAGEVDQTVLLVDADLRAPAVHRCFGFKPTHGLSDHLICGTPLDQLLVNPGIERFVVLPGGRPLLNSSEMLGSMKMDALVQELKSRYPSRIVVFDLPPVLCAADVLAFGPYVDAAMMVVAENRTDREELARALEMLRGVRVLGTVLNRSTEQRASAPARRRGALARWFDGGNGDADA